MASIGSAAIQETMSGGRKEGHDEDSSGTLDAG